MNEENRCPMCPNHCEKDNLSCHRGEEYFSTTSERKEPSTIEEKVISDLRACGHMLHHNRDLDIKSVLGSLNAEELEILHKLLSKIGN